MITPETIRFTETILNYLREYAKSSPQEFQSLQFLSNETNIGSISAETHLATNADNHWREIAHLFIETEAADQLRLSIRITSTILPRDCVDFLEIQTATEQGEWETGKKQPAHLLVIYLSNGNTGAAVLNPVFIPANRWSSVTQISWGDAHPFVDLLDNARIQTPQSSTAESPQNPTASPIQPKQPTPGSPLVSIITIVYNGEEYLEQTIQSVINQSYENIEYIIIDGGSTDSTLDIVDRYADHIDVVVSEQDKGIYDALNKGIALARGELVGAIHANDFYAPGAVAALVRNAEQHPEKSFFHARITYLDENRAWILGKPITKTWQMVDFGNFYHPTCFVRKSVYNEQGDFKLTYPIASDYDLGVRYWKAGVPFHYIDQNFAYFRLGGLSSDLYQNQWERHLIRLENGENVIYSFGILVLVIANFHRNRIKKLLAP